jgi:poly(3-hydroxybutyrate) depolymerase
LKNLTLLFLLFALGPARAQEMHRYKDLVFASADVKSDMNYAADSVAAARRKYYTFDLYTPHGDTARKRPLMIWIHGGGFIFGSKTDDNIRLWSTGFARRGYVCASINYRLGKTSALFNFGKLVSNAYPAVLDARQAVAYFRRHSHDFGIDPDRIVLAGNSAGAMIALQTAFSNNRELADSVRIANPAAFGAVDAGPTRVLAVVNFWGGIYNINWLKNASVPVINIYGSKDHIVHPGFSKGTYGGEAIYNKLTALKRNTGLRVFEGYGHELYRHFNPLPHHPGKKGIRKRWQEAANFAADFLYKLM